MEGSTKEELVEAGNLFCKERSMDELGFEVREEFRRQRDDMLQCQTQEKKRVRRLMAKLSWWDRLLS